MQPFQILDQGLVFDADRAPPDRQACYFTSLARLDSGTLLAGWQTGPTKHSPTNTIRIARSVDGAKSWQVIPWDFATSLDGTPWPSLRMQRRLTFPSSPASRWGAMGRSLRSASIRPRT